MKKIIIALIIFTIFMTAGCGAKLADSSSDVNITKDITLPSVHPKPNSEYEVEWECGTYYSDISVGDMEGYLKKLKGVGWENIYGGDFTLDIAEGTSQYMLSNGNSIMQIMMILIDKGQDMGNSILVKLDQNISVSDIKNRKGVLSKREALDKIQPIVHDMVENGEIAESRKTITGIFELFIEDAFEKMNIQAYAAVNDHGFTGCFILRNGTVQYVPGDLNNVCIADIDKNGKYELLEIHREYGDIIKIELSAYSYINPVFFSSLTEVLMKVYYNCFVPKDGYPQLRLEKIDDANVRLIDDNRDYGILIIKEDMLVVENMDNFPFEQWKEVYDQSKLVEIKKEIPEAPPEIKISIEGQSIDYILQKTTWDGVEQEKKSSYREIKNKNTIIPTFQINDEVTNNNNSKLINIDFGNNMPDSIVVTDSILNDDGNIRYTEREIMERTVAIRDNKTVEFHLKQHMAIFLSSNSEDYEKDWYRLFKVSCSWGDNECEYSFLINTIGESTRF